jgi:hypothetical protein
MATETPTPRKRGRPRATVKRDVSFSIQLTSAEAELLRQRSEAAGFPSLASWMRIQLGLPAVPR